MQARELERPQHVKLLNKSLTPLSVSEGCSIDRVNVYFTVEVFEDNSVKDAIRSLETKLTSSDVEHFPIQYPSTFYFQAFCNTLSFFFL